jgi:hypothetical protein
MLSKIFLVAFIALLQSCYIVDFFNHKSNDGSGDGEDDPNVVLGLALPAKAGGRDEDILKEVYATPAKVAPASVRPDPDTFAKLSLRQFRSESATLARQIGKIEAYKLLLGGAPRNFSTPPSETYDATSVLATMRVAEELCRALVSPTGSDHQGWQSVLPEPASKRNENLRWLLQRFTGLESSKISSDQISALEKIMEKDSGEYQSEDYVMPCVAIYLDARAMML